MISSLADKLNSFSRSNSLISWKGAKDVVVLGALAVYTYDCYYAYNYLESYYKQFDGMDIEDEKNQLLKAHSDDTFLISREMFEKRLKDFCDELDSEGHTDEAGIYPDINGLLMKVGRESIGFSGGGRAAILQLYHPFIAKGIDLHSSLAYGIQRRFYNTFKYVFAMNFGTREDALKAARTVRSMHDKVNGEMGEQLGIYKHASKFDAAQTAAVIWVAATLVETLIFEYEIHVKMLSEEEKDEIVKEGGRLGAMFGIPKELIPKSYKQFLKYNHAMWNSEICAIGPTTDRIVDFLLEPPTLIHAPLLYALRWKTAVSMPPRFGPILLRREITWFDKILFAILVAQIRFIYRLLPGAFRYLTPYLAKERRYGIFRTAPENILSSISAKIANIFLAFAMPPRDPEKIKASLKELEERKLSAKKNASLYAA